MLRITVELVPHGNEQQKKTIGVMHVANVGGEGNFPNYKVVEMEEREGVSQWIGKHVYRHVNVFEFLAELLRKREEPRG